MADDDADQLRERIWILAKQRPYPAWEPCCCCDEFWCNVHDCHAFECECPLIDEWTSDPYADPVCDGLQDCLPKCPSKPLSPGES